MRTIIKMLLALIYGDNSIVYINLAMVVLEVNTDKRFYWQYKLWSINFILLLHGGIIDGQCFFYLRFSENNSAYSLYTSETQKKNSPSKFLPFSFNTMKIKPLM